MNRFSHSTLASLLLLLGACSPPDPAAADAAVGGEADAAEASTNRVDIPATVRKNLGITFATVEVRNVTRTLRIPGAFELQPLARHEYHMVFPGRVQLLVDQYELVEVGTPLYRFQSPEWPDLQHEIIVGEQEMATARADIEVGLATLDETRRNLSLVRERIEALARADFRKADFEVRASELEASLPRLEAELELARTRLANAEHTRRHALRRASAAIGMTPDDLAREDSDNPGVPRYIEIDWIEVRADEEGIVESLAVTDGAFVESPATVVTTVDPENVRFRALALQADLPRLMVGGRASIVVPPSPAGPTNQAVEATVSIGLEANAEQRTIALIATPKDDAEWIRPGVSAFLEVVVSGTDEPALAVPEAAVVQDGLTHVVFRRDPSNPNQAIRVEADLGASDGLWVVLESGVMRGDEVVLGGAFELKLATQQSGTAQKGGHFHADGSYHGEH
jgi:multidrug resistance efflux pump